MRLKKAGSTVLIALLTLVLTVSLNGLSIASAPPDSPALVSQTAQSAPADRDLLRWAVTEALSIAPSSEGNALLDQGQYQQAIDAYQQALDLTAQQVTVSSSTSVLARRTVENSLYKLGFAYFQVAQFADRLGETELRERALAGAESVLAKAAVSMNVFSRPTPPPQASEMPIVTTSITEATASANYRLEARTFKLLQQIYVAQQNYNQALLIAEKGRTIEIDQNIVSNIWSDSATSDDRNRLFEIADQLVQISDLSIADIQNIARNEDATIVSYSILSDRDDPRPPRTIGLSSTPDEVDSQEKLLIWVIQPTGEITFKQQNLTEIITADTFSQTNTDGACRGQAGVAIDNLSGVVRRTRGCLGISDREVGTANAQSTASSDAPDSSLQLKQLYQLLIPAEVEALLPEDADAHVIFIPQGSLFFIPFPALQTADGEYLVERHTILTAPSLRTLLLKHPRPAIPEVPGVLVVGNPTLPIIQQVNNTPQGSSASEVLPPLEKAGEEAQAIVNLFAQHQFQVTAFINQPAPEDTVAQLMPSAQIIHLASHGILEGVTADPSPESSCNIRASVVARGRQTAAEVQQALDELVRRLRAECEAQINQFNTYSVKTATGAIVLSPSSNNLTNEDDGLLTAREILKMRLNADLVVLSACNTGRGPLTAGGVIGLPFSFSLAGVSNIIVSLWAVPDDSTAELMTNFYQRLVTSDLQFDKAGALRQAMRDFIQAHPEAPPKDWAAFTLIGRQSR